MNVVDLNSDLGEDWGKWRVSRDAEVMSCVTSANVACGFHAGDPSTIRRTVRLARSAGVAIGAHPGWPDLLGFGRRNMEVDPEEARDYVVYQVGALKAFVEAEGGRLTHVKPHGALYNQAAKDKRLAQAIAQAVKEVDPCLILVALPGSELYKAGREAGLLTAGEVFADRAYNPDGTLVPRTRPNAMIKDVRVAIQQVLHMVEHSSVVAVDGTEVPIAADTICIHGDQPDAVAFAKEIRAALENKGIRVAPMSEWLKGRG
ncbi:MAG: LamB/YcsF family protein [Bacillota bacterium]